MAKTLRAFHAQGMETFETQQTPELPTPPGNESTFNVVIVYEDFAAGRHAKETYDYLVQQLGGDLRFENQMWKFDVLGHPALRQMALLDIAAADLIMISTHGERDLSDEVKFWIDEWSKHPASAMALVTLTDRVRDLAREEHSISIRAYLQSVAKKAGMAFFAQPDEWPDRDQEFSMQQITERAHVTSTMMASFLNKKTGWRRGNQRPG